MGFLFIAAVGAMVVLSVFSRPPENLFVLLEEADGTVGAIEIRNDTGVQIIDSANTGVRVRSQSFAPDAPQAIGDAELRAAFADVLAAEPLPAITLQLYFELGTTELTSQSQDTFQQIFEILDSRVLPDIRVIGHTDTLGPRAVNADLARNRADIVARSLLAAGAPADRLVTTSHGERNLLIDTADEVEEPLNRRVEVTIR